MVTCNQLADKSIRLTIILEMRSVVAVCKQIIGVH